MISGRQPTCALGIVSGRRVRELRARVGLDGNVFYIGLHGLEVEGP
jgi:trehalose-6-phosphatase